jgi:hypothetical protein
MPREQHYLVTLSPLTNGEGAAAYWVREIRVTASELLLQADGWVTRWTVIAEPCS